MSGDWGLRTREHEFSTGRSAILRETLPVTQLIREGVFDDELLVALEQVAAGDLRDAQAAFRLADAMCLGMFVSPRISLKDPESGEYEARQSEDGAWEVVPIIALEETEINEVVDLAFKSLTAGARFRGDGSGSGDGDDGADVGSAAKRSGRARAGQPRSAPPRSKARRKA